MTRTGKISAAMLACVAAVVVDTAANPACAAGGGLSAGNLGQGIAALLIFILLLVILGKYAWKPIIAQLQQREADIQQKIDDAEERQKTADSVVAEYEQRLDKIDTESADMIAAARKEASFESQQIIANAHAEARTMIKRAEEDIASAQSQARRNLQADTAKLATDIARNIIRRQLTDDDHKQMLADATQQFAEMTEADK